MYKNAVIPGVDPGSRPFNRSCKPYFNLGSRFTVRCPGMTRKGFTLRRHSELTLCPLSVTPESCNPGSNDSVSESSKKGFTLIELLVVVLIIGILSAVALPQYQVAVGKARLAQLMVLAKAFKSAEEVYFMANGAYTKDFLSLDWEIPSGGRILNDAVVLPNGDSCTLLGKGRHSGQRISCNLRALPVGYHYLLDNSDSPGAQECYASTSSQLPDQICRSLGGRYIGRGGDGTHRVYLLP